MKPKTYEEWLLTTGKTAEIGLKILITYALLRDSHKEIFSGMFKPLEDAFERALFDKGGRPQSITFATDNDMESRAKELCSVIETQQGATLQEFAPIVYRQASDFYHEIKVWENKSLWEYIKWTIKRAMEQI